MIIETKKSIEKILDIYCLTRYCSWRDIELFLEKIKEKYPYLKFSNLSDDEYMDCKLNAQLLYDQSANRDLIFADKNQILKCMDLIIDNNLMEKISHTGKIINYGNGIACMILNIVSQLAYFSSEDIEYFISTELIPLVHKDK